MEIGAVRRMRQSAGTAPVAQSKPKAAAVRPGSDQVTLSRQGAAWLLAQEQERVRRQAAQKEKNWWQLDSIQREEESGSPLDSLHKDMKKQQICHRIAARVMAGDKVPPEDLKYLMENDLQGYQLAMAARMPKEKPREWDSALEEESGSESAGTESGSAGAPEAAAEASEASGEAPV